MCVCVYLSLAHIKHLQYMRFSFPFIPSLRNDTMAKMTNILVILYFLSLQTRFIFSSRVPLKSKFVQKKNWSPRRKTAGK